jgi:sterol desaturase/sphingolipid hydroxylase (fatty acid hydroxylase superfamily)
MTAATGARFCVHNCRTQLGKFDDYSAYVAYPILILALATVAVVHHAVPRRGNFGVTTALWEHVFGTALDGRGRVGH